MIFNLARGTGLRGLCGIPRVRGNIIRPLRDCTREQVEQYLAELGQDYREDSSNLGDDYSRNFIRHHIMPELRQLNPALPQAMSRTMEQMDRQWQMTEQLANQAEEVFIDQSTMNRQALLRLQEPVALLMLGRCLDEAGAGKSARMLELMLETAQRGSGAVELTAGVRLVAQTEQLRLVRELPKAKPFFYALELPQKPEKSVCHLLGNGRTLRITLFVHNYRNFAEKFYNKDLKNLVDCDRIKEHVFVHEPRSEDTIRLQDRKHSLVHRYRSGCKGITLAQLSTMVVVEDADGVAWAERLGGDQNRCAGEGSRGFYYFEVLEDTEK